MHKYFAIDFGKCGFVAGAILAAAFGLASIGQAAPLAAAAVATVQATQVPVNAEARPEKAHYTGRRHTHHHHVHHHYHH